MQTDLRSRAGVALGMTLGALVIVGVIIAGSLYVATQDHRVAANSVRQARAAAAADMGLIRVGEEWKPSQYNLTTSPGDTLQWTYSAGGAAASVLVTRLAGPFFWVVSEGTAGGAGQRALARRRYGMLFRIDTPDIPFMGALTGRGNILVGGSAMVNGKDLDPPGWASCGSRKDIAGIAMSDTTDGLKLPGCNNKHCVDGSPKFVQTLAAADTSTYFVYGNATYQSLAASATKVFPGGLTLPGIYPVDASGACATSFATNWGDPWRASPTPGPCETYYPIIHVKGDLHITGQRGQGILLVDGDLNLTGGFEFTGAVIVRGTLRSTGTGAHVTGAVMAANVELDADSKVLGNTEIQYSSCALQTVMSGAAGIKPVKERAWVNLF